jgi:dTMP kinase
LSFFLAIEGLDGSGKSTAAKGLAKVLEKEYGCQVKLTYEPNDPSAAGEYIRAILKKKITQFHPRVLGYAFATNRLDHNSRVISPWLEKEDGKRVVISDRYYLSSLVYQSSADFPMEKVMELNQYARKPDLIIFINVSEEICFQRIAKRNQPRELFEQNFTETKEKFLAAIDFLRSKNGERIVEVEGVGTKKEMVEKLVAILKKEQPSFFR